jgi:tetratricopeptide (TPR) repeat protein
MAREPKNIKRLLPALISLLSASSVLAELPTSDDEQAIAPAKAQEISEKTEAPATPMVEERSTTTTETHGQIKQQLADLIKQKHYSQAYGLAQQHAEDIEGDPDFDFHYGFSASQSGFYNEALFIFERLSSEFPHIPRYRLELARCYYFTGQLDGSEREFNHVLKSNPPNQVRNIIQTFLTQIEEQRQSLSSEWFGMVSYSGGYDSNINSSTSLSEIDIQLAGIEQTVRLNDNQKARGSGFYKFRGSIGYQTPLTKRSGFDVRFGGQRKANATSNDYDLNSLFVDGGFQFIRGFHRLRAGGNYQQYWLADDSLQTTLAANIGWNYRLSSQWRLNSKFEVRENDNQINDDLDATQFELDAGTDYTNENVGTQLKLSYSTDSAGDSPLARNALGIYLSGQYYLSDKRYTYASIAWRQFDFPNKDENNLLAAGDSRSEDLTQLTLGYNQQLFWPTLSTYAQLSHMDNQSNIDVYKYNRTLIEGGLTLAF